MSDRGLSLSVFLTLPESEERNWYSWFGKWGNRSQRWQLAKEKLRSWAPKPKSGNYDFGFGFFLIFWMKKKKKNRRRKEDTYIY